MRILLLCGSVEEGKDGVGDYVLRLAGELSRKGCECSIIALMDKFVEREYEISYELEDRKIRIVRLPFKSGVQANCVKAENWVRVFKPDCISLQFVPFSFHDRGLSFSLSNAVYHVVNKSNLHIMFHELWVGMDTKATVKLRIWGFLQRRIIKMMLLELKPSIIHTNTALYVNQLSKIGFSAERLPLFGNVPFSECQKILETENTKGSVLHLTFVVFGSIHFGAPVEEFSIALRHYATELNIDITITFVGRCGVELKNWTTAYLGMGFKVNVLGEQPIAMISAILQSADIGISTTPILLAEKSGAAAAMIEHGLPVLCVARPWIVRGFSSDYRPEGITLFEKESLAQFLKKVLDDKRRSKISTLSSVSMQLLDSLKTN